MVESNITVDIDIRHGDGGTEVGVRRVQVSRYDDRRSGAVDVTSAELEDGAIDEDVLIDDVFDEGLLRNLDVIRSGVGVVAIGVACSQGDCIVAHGSVGVDGVLHDRGVAVPEVPEPGGHIAGALIGELDGERRIACGNVCGEICRRRCQDGDIIGPGRVREPVGIACVQGDRVGTGARVGVDGVLHGRGVAVPEVP
ncbi:hypothetical protein DSECCO2_590430 [anaerobic digester metagenome]